MFKWVMLLKGGHVVSWTVDHLRIVELEAEWDDPDVDVMSEGGLSEPPQLGEFVESVPKRHVLAWRVEAV